MYKIFFFQINILLLLFTACTKMPQNAEQLAELPDIFPDYKEVDIPRNIAPLNFIMKDTCDGIYVEYEGKNTSLMISGKDRITIPLKKWHKLLDKNAGENLTVTVYTKNNGSWKKYVPFNLFVCDDPIDSYLVYRLIAPGYQVWSKMGIYQRSLTDFNQEVIIDNALFPGACMNCHSFKQNNPDNMMFHMRSANGGTMLIQDEVVKKLNTKTENTLSNCTYPYWHPSGNYIAFSVNKISQVFHATTDKRVEVVDSESDLVVYDIRKNELLTCNVISTKENFETFPTFSPDGKSLIFCSSKSQTIPEDYNKVKYNLCAIAFDPETGSFGDQIDTLVNAEAIDKSISFPRVSPDGNYLMFTMAGYGNFSIWHKDADLYMLNLHTKKYYALDEVNSNDMESYHSWSSNSRWFVFSSRRIDGLYTRPFMAHIDENGKIGKPFLLPQKNPDFYMDLMESFNIPEFVTGKVNIEPNQIEKIVLGEKGLQVGYRKM